MTLKAHVRNGMIVLDELVALPEGATVQVELSAPAAPWQRPGPGLGRDMLTIIADDEHLKHFAEYMP
jgi:hypothetical protein